MKLLIQFATFSLLILVLFFVSCKKEYAPLQSSQRDTTYDHLAADYKLDTTFTFTAYPPYFGIGGGTATTYISEHRIYLPILSHINTKNLKVTAWYSNHRHMELPQDGSRYSRSGSFIFVFIQVMEMRQVVISVRITT